MKPTSIAVTLILAGEGCIVAGVAVLFGLGWALVAGGVAAALAGMAIVRGMARA